MLRCAWLTCIPLHSFPFHAEHCNLVGAEGRLPCSDTPFQKKNNPKKQNNKKTQPTNKTPNSTPHQKRLGAFLLQEEKNCLLCVARRIRESTLPFSVCRQQSSEPTRECQGMPVLVDQALFCQTEVQSLWEQFPGIPSQGSLSHTLLHNAGWPTRSRFCSSVALLLQQVRHTKQPGNAACRLCQGQRGPPPTV